jgi:hypothetical protein
LADALQLLRDARATVARGGTALDIEGAKIRQLAEEQDAIRKWDDPHIRSTIWGKLDKQAGSTDQVIAVTPDAIRKQLTRLFGRNYGNAIFYAGREFGISRTAAEALREIARRAEKIPVKQRPWRPPHLLMSLCLGLWHGIPGQSPSLGELARWIREYLRTNPGVVRKERSAARTVARRRKR